MSLFVVDVESDGPIPLDYSMVCFGVVRVDEDLATTFYGQTAPITSNYDPEALAISGFTREEHERFPVPINTMKQFDNWLEEVNKRGRPIFISDNVAYDWQWINWYYHHYLGKNPFGYSGRRVGDVYAGLVKDFWNASQWRKYRKTKHTHHPVDDAKGVAEGLLSMKELGLKM